jgi:hypothetical protein
MLYSIVGHLLEAVQGLHQPTDLFLLTLNYETFGLNHIDFFFQLAKKVRGRDI